MLAFSQAHGSTAAGAAAGAVALAVALVASAKILVVVAFGLAVPAFDTKQ